VSFESNLRFLFKSIAPSRDMDRPKPWEEDEIDRGSHFRSSYIGRSYIAPINYNGINDWHHFSE